MISFIFCILFSMYLSFKYPWEYYDNIVIFIQFGLVLLGILEIITLDFGLWNYRMGYGFIF